MHFSHMNNGSGSKITKIAIVSALHLAVGIALVNNMNTVKSGPSAPGELDVVIIQPKVIEPPPPPPPPTTPMQESVNPPTPIVPLPDVVVEPTHTEPTMTATYEANPLPADPGPVTAVVAPAQPANKGSAIRTAVLADGAGCATPDYPARAARSGETGTVSLALLVGADGRVADARIQKSSGSRDLDRAAVSALSMCKFKPATNGGVAEQGWAQIAYVWTLDS